MRRLSLALSALVATASFATATVLAAEPTGKPLGGPRIERLATELGLDEYQKTEMKRIFEEHRARMESDRKQSAEELRQQLSGVLTAEQLQKFEQRMQQRVRRGPPHRRAPRGEQPTSQQ